MLNKQKTKETAYEFLVLSKSFWPIKNDEECQNKYMNE